MSVEGKDGTVVLVESNFTWLICRFLFAAQINKAEKIARERLKEQETAPMWAALGDITRDPSCWEKAWELSGGRYARAKVFLRRLAVAPQRLDWAYFLPYRIRIKIFKKSP